MTTPAYPAKGGLPSILTGQVPYSQEAEEALVGAILMSQDARTFLDCAAFLQADDFYILRHTYIWQAMERLNRRETQIDYLTVQEELRAVGRLNDIGGPAYLTQLMNSMPTSMNVMDYGRIVERAALRRRGMAAADAVKVLLADEARDAETAYVDGLRLFDAAQRRISRSYLPGALSISEYDAVLDDLAGRYERGEMIGYPLPEKWHELADCVPFVLPGHFTVVSGPHGSGKSAFLESWAEHLAGLGLPTDYIHTEMSQADMLHRRKARYANVPFYVLASGNYPPETMKRIVDSDARIAQFAPNLNYNHMTDVPFELLATELRRAAMAGVKAFFLDHFQDVKPPGRGDDPRGLENAVAWLAAFAEKRNVFLAVASQENAAGKTKWTTKLTEKAVIWISIKRNILKGPYAYRLNGIDIESEPGQHSPIGEVNVKKVRFGKLGKKKMLYHGPAFDWMDMMAIERPTVQGKVLTLPGLEDIDGIAREGH